MITIIRTCGEVAEKKGGQWACSAREQDENGPEETRAWNAPGGCEEIS